ncbi:MAG: hypothetical protein JOZ80_06100 [Acidobacteriaceae bacterium]|jgi:hypothetical protein|nr:hypothetical protein [Acidobacteriaceae bacterium]
MTIHDEFLEILRILEEDPDALSKKPPERSATSPDSSFDGVSGKRKEAAS